MQTYKSNDGQTQGYTFVWKMQLFTIEKDMQLLSVYCWMYSAHKGWPREFTLFYSKLSIAQLGHERFWAKCLGECVLRVLIKSLREQVRYPKPGLTWIEKIWEATSSRKKNTTQPAVPCCIHFGANLPNLYSTVILPTNTELGLQLMLNCVFFEKKICMKVSSTTVTLTYLLPFKHWDGSSDFS